MLASVFLISVWIDPTQPTYFALATYLVLVSFLSLSLAHLTLTWNRWEIDHRLALPAHIIDIAIFTALVFLTEGYTSPFFSFFIFLLLSATIRWGWFATASTAIIVIILFSLAGSAALYIGTGEFELQRVLIRSSYLVVLSLILIWLGMNQDPRRDIPVGVTALEELPTSAHVPLSELAEFVRYTLSAGRVLLFLWDKDEPSVLVEVHEGQRVEQHRLPSAIFERATARALEGLPFLFDVKKKVALASHSRKRRQVCLNIDPIDPDLASKFEFTRGLAIPCGTAEYKGMVIIDRSPGLSSDDLIIAKRISNQMGAVLQRVTAMQHSEQAAATRTRLSLSRDIHDSSVQLLAGLSFRLEALRHKLPPESEVNRGMGELQKEIAAEHKELRKLMAVLRSGVTQPTFRDLSASVIELAERLSSQWNVRCHLLTSPTPTAVSMGLGNDVHQLIREAVANAVRHGQAKNLSIALNTDGDGLHLEVRDDGSGFQLNKSGISQANARVGPWSLHERTRALGGSLAIETNDQGSRITITLPYETST